MNEYDEMSDSAGYADTLPDAGFWFVVLLAFAAFCAVLYWLVPPMARYFAGYWS